MYKGTQMTLYEIKQCCLDFLKYIPCPGKRALLTVLYVILTNLRIVIFQRQRPSLTIAHFTKLLQLG